MAHAMTRWMVIFGLVWLAGCGQSSPVEYKPLYFTQYQPIYMAVSSIEIVEDYKSPQRPPYIEHLIPYAPAEALRIWVRDRLRTAGGNKTMQVIIRNGSVIATPVAGSGMGGGVIPLGGDRRYVAKLEVEMRLYGEGVISEASIFVNATRNMVMSENADDATRNRAFRKLITDMMDEFNAEMEKNLFMYMGNYISYTQSP